MLRVAVSLWIVTAAGCSAASPAVDAPLAGPSNVDPAPSAPPSASSPPVVAAPAAAAADTAETEAAPVAPCPPDMVHVRHEYCEELEHRCIKSEYDKSNRITICHEFAEGQKTCRGERRLVDVCVDRYEYPNQKGGHPPVMVDFFGAEQRCQEGGKRLCLESEWVAACEGPREKPFPYGWQRSAEACNIDNRWLEPNLGRVYAKDAE